MSDRVMLFSQRLKKYLAGVEMSRRRQFLLLSNNPDEAITAERAEWTDALAEFEKRGWLPCLIGV